MSRLQLALNVADIDAAVEFYSTLFGTEPAKRRPGYANFAVVDPPLKLVLFENPERHRHAEPPRRRARVDGGGRGRGRPPRGRRPELEVEGDVVCCYARQDKHWVAGPDGQRWENYVVLADAQPELEGRTHADLGSPRRGRRLLLDGARCDRRRPRSFRRLRRHLLLLIQPTRPCEEDPHERPVHDRLVARRAGAISGTFASNSHRCGRGS